MFYNPLHMPEQLNTTPTILWVGKPSSKRLRALFEATQAQACLAQAMFFLLYQVV